MNNQSTMNKKLKAAVAYQYKNCYKLPPYLQPGDLAIAIAPSGALKKTDALEQGLEVWRSQGYRVELGEHWDSQEGYLAGTDTQRRQALASAWNNPECKAILCIRGGYGSARLLEDWTWNQEVTPKWVIGFSDVTSLLWSLATVGIGSIHAPVLTTIGSEGKWSQQRLFNYLAGKSLPTLEGIGWNDKTADGFLLPGNLTVATHLLGTSLQPEMKGVILALEDVTEYPYRIDRMLTQWRLMGVLKQIKGIALGRFSRCEPYPGTNSWTVAEVLRDRSKDLDIPIVSDLPFGHDGVNAALPVGHPVTLDAGRGELIFH
ncbi:MAG: LD-carboxypeptidase [Xenococcaceae cyanobacterium MO_188.B19]|nr:LD-carboxypeptidase [Xenococcaceae cyanobacterium MO_188.B19]